MFLFSKKYFSYNTDLPFLLSPLSCLSHPSHFTDTFLLWNDVLLLRGSRDSAHLDLNHSSDFGQVVFRGVGFSSLIYKMRVKSRLYMTGLL